MNWNADAHSHAYEWEVDIEGGTFCHSADSLRKAGSSEEVRRLAGRILTSMDGSVRSSALYSRATIDRFVGDDAPADVDPDRETAHSLQSAKHPLLLPYCCSPTQSTAAEFNPLS